jgi:creatinine amidohydrolase
MSAPVAPLRWAEQSGPELRALFADDPDCVALIPIGATEQHGPHLPTGTDTIIATALADALSGKGSAVVLPPLVLGASQWHGTVLGGTIALTGAEVATLADGYARWAVHTGVRKLLFVNGHVGNAAPLWLACDQLRFSVGQLAVGVLQWWNLNAAIAAEAVADAEDWHANRAETSLMLAVAPELVRLDLAATADEPDRSTELVFRYGAGGLTRNGVTGSPSQASADLGARLWRDIVTAGRSVVAQARLERPPLTSADTEASP